MSTRTVPIFFAVFVTGFGITGAMVVPFLSCLYILFLGLRSTREKAA
jgi:hypothetical protein